MDKITPLKLAERKKTRISAKLRRAIDLRVRKGLTIARACEEAGDHAFFFAKRLAPSGTSAVTGLGVSSGGTNSER